MGEVQDKARRLLLVDDDDLVRRSIRLVVRRVCTQLEECRAGNDALEAVRRNPPAGVLLDLGLPDMSGVEVLGRLKHEAPEVPVVVVSGASSIDDALEAMKLGADDFITKPFLPERLLAAVRNLLRVADLQGRVALLERAIQHETSSALAAARLPGYDAGASAAGPDGDELLPLREVERHYVAYVVERCDGDLSAAARVLGIGVTSLHGLLERCGLLCGEAR